MWNLTRHSYTHIRHILSCYANEAAWSLSIWTLTCQLPSIMKLPGAKEEGEELPEQPLFA